VASEGRHKGATPLASKSPVVDEEMMRPCHWLGLVHCVPFGALTQMVGRQEEHPGCKKPVPLISRGSVPEQVEERIRRETG